MLNIIDNHKNCLYLIICKAIQFNYNYKPNLKSYYYPILNSTKNFSYYQADTISINYRCIYFVFVYTSSPRILYIRNQPKLFRRCSKHNPFLKLYPPPWTLMKNSISRVYIFLSGGCAEPAVSMARTQTLFTFRASRPAQGAEIDSTSSAQRQTIKLFHGFNAFSLSTRRRRKRRNP